MLQCTLLASREARIYIAAYGPDKLIEQPQLNFNDNLVNLVLYPGPQMTWDQLKGVVQGITVFLLGTLLPEVVAFHYVANQGDVTVGDGMLRFYSEPQAVIDSATLTSHAM